MNLFLSPHAVRRMKQRNITRDEVNQAIANRGTMYPSADDDSRAVILGTTAAGRKLKVVVDRGDHSYVVTAADREDER